ncbi:hypothetical protein NUSPORA_01056 [Nucleospora cyclopteri]
MQCIFCIIKETYEHLNIVQIKLKTTLSRNIIPIAIQSDICKDFLTLDERNFILLFPWNYISALDFNSANKIFEKFNIKFLEAIGYKIRQQLIELNPSLILQQVLLKCKNPKESNLHPLRYTLFHIQNICRNYAYAFNAPEAYNLPFFKVLQTFAYINVFSRFYLILIDIKNVELISAKKYDQLNFDKLKNTEKVDGYEIWIANKDNTFVLMSVIKAKDYESQKSIAIKDKSKCFKKSPFKNTLWIVSLFSIILMLLFVVLLAFLFQKEETIF